MSGPEHGKRTGQHQQRKQQASLIDEDAARCYRCGAFFTADECPECADTDWARDERARRAVDQAAEDAAQEGE